MFSYGSVYRKCIKKRTIISSDTKKLKNVEIAEFTGLYREWGISCASPSESLHFILKVIE